MPVSSHFYNQTTKKLIICFGNIFNNIFIKEYDENGNATKTTRVPLVYGPKEKFLRRIKEDRSITSNVDSDGEEGRTGIATTLPRMSFEMVNFFYDPQRKNNPLNKMAVLNTSSELYSRFERVPYNFEFQLYIATKKYEDGLQIVEQILPYFNPEYTVTVKNLITDLNTDIPIILTSSILEDSYDGSPEEMRKIIWTLTFTAKAYIYGPVKEQGIILDADVYVQDLENYGMVRYENYSALQAGLTLGETGYLPYAIISIDGSSGPTYYSGITALGVSIVEPLAFTGQVYDI